MADRITKKRIDQYVEDLNALGRELELEGAGEWIVANAHGSGYGAKSLLRQYPADHSISTRTALGEHTWDTNREIRAGLRGLIAGLRAVVQS